MIAVKYICYKKVFSDFIRWVLLQNVLKFTSTKKGEITELV